MVEAGRELPALVFLAYRGGEVVGIATCFLGFSTFAARPLVNVHDFSVLPNHRGFGVGRALLTAVERAARARGCVKMTLEVLEKNVRARRIYAEHGFSSGPAPLAAGGALFYTKAL